MISEKEVLDSLDRLGEKLLDLRKENNGLKENLKSTEELLQEITKKYESAITVIKHIVENTIESKLEPLIESVKSENELLNKNFEESKSKIAELENQLKSLKEAADNKDRSLEAINNRLKSFYKATSDDLDIDNMITKIHTSDYDTSDVDEKLKEIKNDRFTNQYEWGRATKETEEMFIDFVKRLWDNYAVVGNYKILNRISDVKNGLDDITLNTFVKYLLDKKFIIERDTSEYISTYDVDTVIQSIMKKDT